LGFHSHLTLAQSKERRKQVPTLAFRVVTDKDYNPLMHRVDFEVARFVVTDVGQARFAVFFIARRSTGWDKNAITR
jgi:hypothetical protein